jgi:hypothetical protein
MKVATIIVGYARTSCSASCLNIFFNYIPLPPKARPEFTMALAVAIISTSSGFEVAGGALLLAGRFSRSVDAD